ncbi:peptidyl-alpha-hydroxyglycine alpha-amidating lyase 1-like [Neodiprion virginianus]|uniref:peptidyl-alpha-hydroxyglycine alpha-amidating lyase 1-like n=1 Tax=Neodiprion virginianus TaxID=2961670 RepID=UPI001EE74366|nr:peptidyl-alpha-hydroxyglycine alpha-amidating lyase 1-like [Neodiprion virginianus]
MTFCQRYLNPSCLASLTLAVLVNLSSQTSVLQNSQIQTPYLSENKFHFNDYTDYTDNDNGNRNREKDKERGPQAPPWSPLLSRDVSSSQISPGSNSFSEKLDPSIVWDDKWASDITFGQLSAVSIDPEGNVAVFHRGSRVWNIGSFGNDNKFDREAGPVRENTIVLINSDSGQKISEWGNSMFYMPHGLTVDHLGNYWITDVAMHQVFKFDANDLAFDKLQKVKTGREFDVELKLADSHMLEEKIGRYEIKPSLILGEAFEPGNSNTRFCKPTAVAVQKNGDFYVSDGYCNSRIIKFNGKGERILTWGRHWEGTESRYFLPPSNAFLVPHALALAEDLDYIFVADRENGRISCFHANNGSFHKEYKHPSIGDKIYSVAYANEKIYLVNNGALKFQESRGFVIDINNGSILSQFGPHPSLQTPHDIAVSSNEAHIYVVELNPHKIYKFSQVPNSPIHQQQQRRKGELSSSVIRSTVTPPRLDSVPLTGIDRPVTVSHRGVTATTIVLSLVTAAVVLVALCFAIAAIIARCRKRGCLLTVRRDMRGWESERRENFKLSNFSENRKSKGRKFFDKRPNTRDFSKLNTEPETSDDENNLTKVI